MNFDKILKLDVNYVPQSWISQKEAILHEATDEVIDHLGKSIVIWHGGYNKDGERSFIETSSIIVVNNGPTKRKHRDPTLTNESLFQRDRNICAYCGGVFKSHDLTRDHIHPTSKGGRDAWMNVVSACGPCNRLKANLMPGQKLPNKALGPQLTGRMDPLYVPYVPCRAEHMILRNKSIKFDQMEFLLAQVKNKNSRVFDYANELMKKAA